jgi:CDP-diacylglycerol---serine O-phosphatidyltransferase
MNLRKSLFILPNLFTLSSVFCGLFAVTVVCDNRSIDGLYQAAIAICFALIFDLTDGRVARLTKTQSSLGLQLDSLADVISFGLAPALLVYRWGLSRFGRGGLFIAFLFCGAAALRLARFNVLAMRAAEEKPGKFILGLPVPVAASVLVSLVILNHQLAGSFVDVGQASLALLVIVLSYLMVSRIRFRSFKDMKLISRRTFAGVLALCGFTVAALAAKMQSAFLFVALLAAYLALGLGEEVIFYRRRRAEERRETVPAEGGAQSDEEVLAELGAFDGPDGPSDGQPEARPAGVAEKTLAP